jgi:hypothetical protein
MKIMFPRFLLAFVLFASAALLFAEDFKSKVIAATDSRTITVRADQLLVIRNFTQEYSATTTSRGTVALVTDTGNVNVLTAAILDISSSPAQEIINRVVIAGPATVLVTCGDGTGNCFVTYKKDSNN